jgi:hypothetical protein
MSIPRFRVPDETRLPSHPVGEVVTYDDHAAEMDRVRHLMDKTSRDNMALRSQNTRLQAEVERLREALARRRRYCICDCHPAARAALEVKDE